MEYLVLFLLMMAVLIAAYFYLERAKMRDGNRPRSTKASATSAQAADAAPPSTDTAD